MVWDQPNSTQTRTAFEWPTAVIAKTGYDVDPMLKSTSTTRNSFMPYAIVTSILALVGAVAGVLAGVTPATAASLAREVDTQIAVFMVPLTLLVLAIMFEVTRMVLRGSVPAELPAARNRRPLSVAEDRRS
jgi:ABC-type dipeptide/oligopeptide/nickel transport system permease subunit